MIALAGLTVGLLIVLIVYSIACVDNSEKASKEDSDYDEMAEPAIP